MKYVDGFVLVVPKNKIEEYRRMAKEGEKMWKKNGALEYYECVGEDLNPKSMGVKLLTFPKLTKLKKGETVFFSFIVYKSREHRDKVNAKVMKEMENAPYNEKSMPFDMKRMAYGGFKVIVGG